MKRQSTQDLMRDNSLQELNRESLGKRFEARIKMLLQCLSKADPKGIPQALTSYLRSMLQIEEGSGFVKAKELSPMEQNRLQANQHTGLIE